ncbi:hypothetical protein ACFY5D_18115 [Paeniglutamicibacter sp. NPDC012692]|uniref:hypothetical protein n=1 Tax=Paeniglutamicibacter sp. NPDC012692 TaxID=3364388 RepID=UPI0036B019E2
MAIKSHKLGPGFLKFGETASLQEFGSQCTAVKLEPSVDEEDNIPVLSGEELEGDETESYMLTGSFLQDYGGMTSLLVWCKTNAGKVLPFEFTPSTAGGLTIKGSVKIRAVAIGGDVKTRNTTDFEFKGIGDWVPSAVPAG